MAEPPNGRRAEEHCVCDSGSTAHPSHYELPNLRMRPGHRKSQKQRSPTAVRTSHWPTSVLFYAEMNDDDNHDEFEVMSGAFEGGNNHAVLGFQIGELKDCIQRDLNSFSNELKVLSEMQKSIMDRLHVLGAQARRIGEPNAEDLVCITCKKDRNTFTLPIKYFHEALMEENAVVPLFQMGCILTVASFALQVPNGSFLAPRNTMQGLRRERNVVKDASGFSLLAFASKNQAKALKARTGVGRMWSLFLKEAMVYGILYAREELFDNSPACGPDIQMENSTQGTPRASPEPATTRTGAPRVRRLKERPTWLTAMHPPALVRDVVKAVSLNIDDDETRPVIPQGSTQDNPRNGGARSVSSAHSGSDSHQLRSFKRARLAEGRPLSRRGLGSESELELIDPYHNESQGHVVDSGDSERVSGVGSEDFMITEYRLEAAKKLRLRWKKMLNHSRTEMRSRIHLHLMFLQEFIEEKFLAKEGSVAEGYAKASEAGYEYKFNDADAQSELTIPAMVKGTIWDIPLSVHGNPVTARDIASGEYMGPDSNMVKIEKLKKDFQCLTVVLRYQVEVTNPPADALEGGESRLFYKREEKCELHDLAMTILVELFKVKDTYALLAISALSIRTVHIIAIACRALLRDSLGMQLLPMEKIALGNAVHRELANAFEDAVTTRLSARLPVPPITSSARSSGRGSARRAGRTYGRGSARASGRSRSSPSPEDIEQGVTRKKNLDKKMKMTYAEYQEAVRPPPVPPPRATLSSMQATQSGGGRSPIPGPPQERDTNLLWFMGGD